jgi:hypothetical protein
VKENVSQNTASGKMYPAVHVSLYPLGCRGKYIIIIIIIIINVFQEMRYDGITDQPGLPLVQLTLCGRPSDNHTGY